LRRPRLPAFPVTALLTVTGLALLVVAAFSVPVEEWNLTLGFLTAGLAALVLEWCVRE
jgi:hypothetical protein